MDSNLRKLLSKITSPTCLGKWDCCILPNENNPYVPGRDGYGYPAMVAACPFFKKCLLLTKATGMGHFLIMIDYEGIVKKLEETERSSQECN